MSIGVIKSNGCFSGVSPVTVYNAAGLAKYISGCPSGSPAVVAWGSITGTITAQTDLITYLSTNYVPVTRILTINGVSYDLSADRTWTITTGGDSLSPFLLMGG
jgi:hypothetical protein